MGYKNSNGGRKIQSAGMDNAIVHLIIRSPLSLIFTNNRFSNPDTTGTQIMQVAIRNFTMIEADVLRIINHYSCINFLSSLVCLVTIKNIIAIFKCDAIKQNIFYG